MRRNPTTQRVLPPFGKGGQGGFDAAMRTYARYLKLYARRLRANMTDAEQRLWHRLRRKQLGGVQFYRQKPLGRWIVDFHAPAVGLVVEVDGGQHFAPDAIAKDTERTAALARMGLTVLRFDDRQVLLEMEAVLDVIWRVVEAKLAKNA
jgi:very-short-patch-repair endonuclease